MIACNPPSIEQHFVGPDDPGNKIYVAPLVLLKQDLQVTLLHPDTTSETLVEGEFADYTVQSIGTDFTAAQITLTTLGENKIRDNGIYGVGAGASQITLVRFMDICQLIDYIENEDFPADSHEFALDYLTLLVAQIQRSNLNLAIQFPVTTPPTAGGNILPLPSVGAGKTLALDPGGKVVTVTPTNTPISVINDILMGGGTGSSVDPASVASIYTFVKNIQTLLQNQITTNGTNISNNTTNIINNAADILLLSISLTPAATGTQPGVLAQAVQTRQNILSKALSSTTGGAVSASEVVNLLNFMPEPVPSVGWKVAQIRFKASTVGDGANAIATIAISSPMVLSQSVSCGSGSTVQREQDSIVVLIDISQTQNLDFNWTLFLQASTFGKVCVAQVDADLIGYW